MKNVLLWILAFIITASAALYQRMTGPTHPIRGKVMLNDTEISFRLERDPETTSDYEVQVKVPQTEITGTLLYKRHKTDDPWTKITMVRQEDFLAGSLPKQPTAGKLEYKIFLASQGKEISLSGEKPVIIRFKDPVPTSILILHIVIIFLAMMFSTRAGIEALNPKGNPRKLVLWTIGLLIVGGFILGPVVQKYAFGEFWTGFPFGSDLTDNKILFAMIGWIAALIAGRKGKPARWWVLGASILLLAVYLIPHSLLGSELDYSQLDSSSALQEKVVNLQLP
jgi:hypothetical protein